MSKLIEIAHTAKEEDAAEPMAPQRRLGAGRTKDVLEGGRVIGSEGTDAALGQRHKCRNWIVLIRRERLVVPDRAPVIAEPGVELVSIVRKQPTHREAELGHARLLCRGVPIARL